MDYVTVYETQLREEAIVIESALQSSGIDCKIDQESVAKFYSISTCGLGTIRVMVPQANAAEAIALIEASV